MEWGFESTLRSSNSGDRMSAWGQKQTFSRSVAMSALPPKADIDGCNHDVRLVPKADMGAYSITSSARAINVGGTITPSALAVFRLIRSSNLAGCSTGNSPGFSPFKIRST